MRRSVVVVSLCLVAAWFLPSPTAWSQDDLEAKALAILSARCASCHGVTVAAELGKGGRKPHGGFGSVDDLGRLKGDARYLIPGDPEHSLVYEQIRDDQMPYRPDLETVAPLPAEEKKAIRDWIASLGRGEAAPQMRPKADQVSTTQLLNGVHDDLAAHVADAPHLRYLTLAHLWNAAEPQERIERTVHGIVKLLNSLSWADQVYVPPSVMKQPGVLLRVDLRALHWDAAKWESIVAAYPYGVIFGPDQESQIAQWTDTQMAYVRGDWFLFEASKPPLYHGLLEPLDAPGALATDAALEHYLGIDVRQSIRNGTALRGGYKEGDSGVSKQNRVIERHPMPRWKGAYWKSYDFKAVDENPKGRLVDLPLGPVGATDPVRRLSDFEFQQNGGEIIFNLPNGMQGYLLVDAAGGRIDEGPADIVFDRESATAKESVIVNGISCIACHITGMKEKADTLTSELRDAHDVRPGVAEQIERQYRPGDLKAAFAEDRDRFLAALDREGVPRPSENAQVEPVVAARKLFERPVSAALAAAELGFSTSEKLLRALGGELQTLRDDLEKGKAIGRSTFKGLFPKIVTAVKIGSPLTPSPAVSRPSAPSSAPPAAPGPPARRKPAVPEGLPGGAAKIVDGVSFGIVKVERVGEQVTFVAEIKAMDVDVSVMVQRFYQHAARVVVPGGAQVSKHEAWFDGDDAETVVRKGVAFRAFIRFEGVPSDCLRIEMLEWRVQIGNSVRALAWTALPLTEDAGALAGLVPAEAEVLAGGAAKIVDGVSFQIARAERLGERVTFSTVIKGIDADVDVMVQRFYHASARVVLPTGSQIVNYEAWFDGDDAETVVRKGVAFRAFIRFEGVPSDCLRIEMLEWLVQIGNNVRVLTWKSLPLTDDAEALSGLVPVEAQVLPGGAAKIVDGVSFQIARAERLGERVTFTAVIKGIDADVGVMVQRFYQGAARVVLPGGAQISKYEAWFDGDDAETVVRKGVAFRAFIRFEGVPEDCPRIDTLEWGVQIGQQVRTLTWASLPLTDAR